jgi:phage-related minor tail protein
LSDTDVSALVTEFVRLHAEAKQLNDRLEAVKEQLKRHAASQPRVANAVLLRTGENTVKCGYSMRVSYQAEQLAAVEAMLGTEPFVALFTRKTTFSPVKGSLDAFLASADAATAVARAAILAAAERTEIATVTPVAPKRTTGTPGNTPISPAARRSP